MRVSVEAGFTPFTVIPKGARSRLTTLVNPKIPPFPVP
jgi:hypothetical protein